MLIDMICTMSIFILGLLVMLIALLFVAGMIKIGRLIYDVCKPSQSARRYML